MKIAMPYRQGRISPVFDEATNLVLVETDHGAELRREIRALSSVDPWKRALELRSLGIQVLICGAVSRWLEMILQSAGIIVIARICGPVEEVLAAYAKGELDSDAFRMPGCRRACGSEMRGRREPGDG